jgi:hypothetical protein
MISPKPSAVKSPPQAVGGVGEGAGLLAHQDSGSTQHDALLTDQGKLYPRTHDAIKKFGTC